VARTDAEATTMIDPNIDHPHIKGATVRSAACHQLRANFAVQPSRSIL